MTLKRKRSNDCDDDAEHLIYSVNSAPVEFCDERSLQKILVKLNGT